jgi:hypothetical protein
MAEEKEVSGTSNGEAEFSAPVDTIDNCLNIINTIYEAKADSIVSADEIFAITGKPKGTMGPKISACIQYGFMVNHNKRGYQVTDFGVSIIRPEFEEVVRIKKLEAFNTPPLYKKLIDRYNAKAMPTNKGLLNILVSEFGLNPNSTGPRAANAFIDNCNTLNVTDNGRMRFFMPNVNEPLREEAKSVAVVSVSEPGFKKKNSPDYIDFPIDLGEDVNGENLTVHFVYPKKINEDQLQVIKIMMEAKLKTIITTSKLHGIDKNKMTLETNIQESDSIT